MTITEQLKASDGLLTVKRVAEMLSCHPMTIYGWTKEGKIPHVRICGRVKFDGAVLAAWYAKQVVG